MWGALGDLLQCARELRCCVLGLCRGNFVGRPPDKTNTEQCLLCSPLGWGRTVGDRRLFQARTVFRAGSAVVVCLSIGGAQDMSSPLLEADPE